MGNFTDLIEKIINRNKTTANSNSNNTCISNTNELLDKISSLEKRVLELEKTITQINDISQKCITLKNEIESVRATVQNKNNTNAPSHLQNQSIMKKEDMQKTNQTVSLNTAHFIKLMTSKGDVEVVDVNKSDAFYEMKTNGNLAELRPLSDKSAYLIMQRKYLLEPAFTISGSGQNINVQTPAKYELQSGNLWNIKEKGKIELK